MRLGSLEALVQSGRRDLRIDFFRGLALWFICIDHSSLNILGRFTLAKVSLANAAEVFVLLAGVAAGIVYGRTLDRQGWPAAAGRAVHRAGTVYVVHILTAMLFLILVGNVAGGLDDDDVQSMALDASTGWGLDSFWQLLLLRFQPRFFDILPLYVVFLLFFAGLLPLLRRPVLLLVLSFTVYAAAHLRSLNLPTWPAGQWTFNPLTWQMLYLIGATLGYRPPGASPRSVPFRWWLVACCIVYLVASRSAAPLLRHLDHLPATVAAALQAIAPVLPTAGSKAWLHPMRLLSVLALAYLVGHAIPVGAAWLWSRPAAPFVLMGQHGLAVFSATVPLSVATTAVIDHAGPWFWPAQAAVNGVVLLALVAVAVIAAQLKLARGPRSAPESPARNAGLA